MNILVFDKWAIAVKEGFDAKIKDDKDTNDEIEIEAPNEDNTIKYVVDGNDIKSKKIVSTNGEQEDANIIDDKKLENDIIDAVDAINNIKDRVKANELRRLTGGDKTSDSQTIANIKKIFNTKTNSNRNGINNLYDKINGFLEDENKIWCHLKIEEEEKNAKYIIDKSEVYYKYKPKKGVGKGEYLLPLLFDDVYKQKIYGENTKGDNFIVHTDGNKETTYYLELKAPGASLGFKKQIRDYVEAEISKDNISNDNKEEIYKNAIVTSIIEYAYRLKGSWGNLYMCIFGNTDNKDASPNDILFINFSKITNDDIKPNVDTDRTNLFKKIFNMIEIYNIDDYNKTKRKGKSKKNVAYSFSFTYNSIENEPKLICNLKSETIQDIYNESTILSREKFINEYYSK